MARRTKEEALATRHKLLDAAEHLFQAQGVSRTSLQDIARRAGATRGAVYWHFKDKADLFNAMMERVTLPMEESFHHENEQQQAPDGETGLNAIDRIRLSTVNALRQIVTDMQTRRVFEVATQKVEYVEELQAVRLRHLTVRSGFLERIEQSLETAAGQINLALPVPASVGAQGLHALIDGLIQNWLLDPQAFDLLEVGQCAIDVYLRGLGFPGETQDATAPYGIPAPV
ncbi:transcriptional regulator [Polaromonas sp. CF318]|uniref:TetR family transcriptional regulator n=1 Tax=Polaromonas sp. CF318 TaxID=1144318 RepID=UPI000270EAD9|nr:TetR family transcriptional regulator [Polaromonas sp. CF318]EJL82476.1 transcriptional regulator [Polaromonas sp. CF318]